MVATTYLAYYGSIILCANNSGLLILADKQMRKAFVSRVPLICPQQVFVSIFGGHIREDREETKLCLNINKQI